MSYFERFRYWIAAPLLDELRREWTAFVTLKQTESYDLGKLHGRASGFLEGQQSMLAQMTQILEERQTDLYGMTEQDIERAKKGILH